MISRLRRIGYLAALLLAVQLAVAEEKSDALVMEALPQPLTLEQAMVLAGQNHPDIELAKAGIAEAEARLLLAEAETGFTSYVDVVGKSMKLSTTGKEVDDSYTRLVMNKILYDFGRGSSLEASQTANIDRSRFLFTDARLQHQLLVMQRFYDVILADFKYTVDDEDMVQFFLKFDKKRERATLGMLSEVEVLEAENLFREAMNKRAESDGNRRSARLLLATALNRPEDLPGELVMPEFIDLDAAPPDGNRLLGLALAKNQTIKALRSEVEAARNRAQSERSRYYPTISAEVEVGDYERPTSSRGDYSAALILRVPIYQGKRNQGEIASATATLAKLSAKLQKAELELRLAVMSQLKQLQILKITRESSKQRLRFRDLYLDQRRAMYEMEVATNLSDAQAKLTEAQWLSMKTDIEIALTWARINVLMGNAPTDPLPNIPKEEAEETLP